MDENTPSPGSLRHRLSADPLPWALWLLLRRMASKLKSGWLARVFHAPNLYLGPGCIIQGSRFIHFGSNLYAQGNLWVHAVSTWDHQQFHPFVSFGNHVSFSERVHITSIERIEIGNYVLVGSGVYIGDHHHGSYSGEHQSDPDIPPIHRPLAGGGPVLIEDEVWIGDNSVIIGPVSIGRGAIIGANSVVRRDIPERTIVAGAPARPIKRFNPATSQWERIDAGIDAPLSAEQFKDLRA